LSDAGAAFGEPHREISFHPIEGGAILFDALRRRLYALNPAAGLTWLCIRDGLSQPEAIRAIAEGLGVAPEMAADWCRTSTDMFREFHLLDESAPETPQHSGSRQGEPRARLGRSGETLYFAIFDRTVSVCAPASLHAGILSLLGLLRVGEPSPANNPADRISVDIAAIDGDQWEIAVDGYLEAVCGIGSVVAELERVIVEAVVPATPHVLTLHAGSLQHRDRTILLAGPSGSGKTTLSVALAHAGWTFGGDEIVLMEAGGNFRPLPLPACIKADTFPIVSKWFPALAKVPPHERYGRTIRFLPIPSSRFERFPAIVVFPTFQQQADAAITRIDRFEGLQKLLAQCVFVPDNFDHGDVGELQRFQETAQYYDLTYGSREIAAELLESALKIGLVG
jgi:hypothetical protein